ncbi:RHS repeat-associated core domain-containing protein [Riemerella anatipestifer]|uniref:RHS repeat-associated core domain-containing protein n=1 Tax=Riemerella anatipestifer TaxID=34085 RepID=UPI0030C63444
MRKPQRRGMSNKRKKSEIYSNTITYDANGNMISLLDKKIRRIGYNTLNLPNQVQSAAEGLSYTYRADGVKVSQQWAIFNGFARKDYIDGFHHETKEETMYIGNPVEPQEPILVGDSFETKPTPTPPSYGTQTSVTQCLLFFPTAEGYYDYLHKRYVYHYTDYLGNVRLSYYKGSSNLVIDKESNYYPFGLEHTGYNGLLGNQSYKYTFQGQERQDETGWLSFKWRNYLPDMGRFFNIDPLSEKYAYQSHYNFSENRVVNARELEGLEAVLINDNTVEWRVKVENNLGYYYSETLLKDAGDILSQNGLTVKVIEDSNAKFTVNLSPGIIQNTKDGLVVINGYTQMDGNVYDGTVVSKDNPRTLAHELGHKAGLPHIFDAESKVSNTEENKKNLMNSGANTIETLQDSSGTNLVPSQTMDMKNHIKITSENIERKEQELQK